MKVSEIARIAHEANLVYCRSIEDTTQVHWEEALDWQKKSAVAGVHAALEGRTPAQSHEGWLEIKEKDGWVYGPEKDPEKKTHPCMVPYEDLPEEQKVKDRLFLAVVAAVASLGVTPEE